MLLRQWIDELKKHAPTLKFIVYTGYATMHRDWIARVSEDQTVDDSNQNARKKRKHTDDDTTDLTYTVEETVERIRPHKGESDASFFRRWYASWLEKFEQVDVVFVTYETLAKDLDVALAPKERPRRAASGPPREKPRSVLVMCQYWRVRSRFPIRFYGSSAHGLSPKQVIMDEVQTLDAQSASRGAQMVTSLHRVNSLVLSGTPAKRSVSDLLSSLTFIGVELRPAIWTRFLKPGFREAFQSLFEEVAVRHTKESVKHEADIPPQIRQIIPIKMNVIELQYYRDLLYRNIDSMVAVSGYRDEERLRGLVQTLRAVCTHIQTNDGPRRNDDNRVERMRLVRDNGRVLKDMDEALMKMCGPLTNRKTTLIANSQIQTGNCKLGGITFTTSTN
jgi:E3 ubiquitin-protein ligase SHPRH